MSRILAIDTSTSRSCVAIIQGDKVLYSGYRDGATAHGPSLPALVQEALAVSDVDEGEKENDDDVLYKRTWSVEEITPTSIILKSGNEMMETTLRGFSLGEWIHHRIYKIKE